MDSRKSGLSIHLAVIAGLLVYGTGDLCADTDEAYDESVDTEMVGLDSEWTDEDADAASAELADVLFNSDSEEEELSQKSEESQMGFLQESPPKKAPRF